MNPDPEVVAQVLDRADAAFARFARHRRGQVHRHVPAAPAAVLARLEQLAPGRDTFLELGSGVGTFTVLAAHLGLRAHGIEADPVLFAESERLAADTGLPARFAHGSFVPDEFRDEVATRGSEFLTIAEGEPAYGELGMDLDEFDLLYAFPWPGEEELLCDMVAACGAPHAVLLTYGATDGCRAFRGGAELLP